MTAQQKKGLIIIGAGGHGRVVADTAEASKQWGEIVFLDDRYPELVATGPWSVVGEIKDAAKMRQRFPDAAVGIGNNMTRLMVLNNLRELNFNLPVIAHPTAAISRYASIDDGTVIFAQAAVNIGAKLGTGCIVNTGSKIDHDCILGRGVHVSPGANLAGGVIVGDSSWIGIGVSIKQEIVIGCDVMIGAGAAVVKDLPDGVTAGGVPARIIVIN